VVDAFETVSRVVEQARSFGFRQLPNGAKLYGHVPHVAPEAWLHQLYAPLSEHDILSLEKTLGQTIPDDFREFVRHTNGISLFSGSLSIYGKRISYARSGDEAWQPFCIVTANTLDRPAHATSRQIVVGSYRNDGSLVFLDVNDGIAFRTKSRSREVLNRWTNLWAMLIDETCRLAGLFDACGHKLTDGRTTPPPES
jgi:hypothetical protein